MPRLRDTVVLVAWPLIGRLEQALSELAGRLESVRAELAVLTGSGPPAIPFPSFPAPSQAIVLQAQGRIERGDPLAAVVGAPWRAAALAESELAVAGFLGFAADAADDGQPVAVWFAGACPLFSGLNISPALPDTHEVYVYGPGPPVPYSGVPSQRLYRSCGTVIGPTTILLNRGDLFTTPP